MATGDAPVTSFLNFDGWASTVVSFPTASSVSQMPNIAGPNGVAVFLYARDTNAGNLWFHRENNSVLDSNRRMTLPPGAGRTFFVTNTNLFWFAAATAADVLEIMVETGRGGQVAVLQGFTG